MAVALDLPRLKLPLGRALFAGLSNDSFDDLVWRLFVLVYPATTSFASADYVQVQFYATKNSEKSAILRGAIKPNSRRLCKISRDAME